MATHLIIDLSDPDVAAEFKDCKPGEEKTFNGLTGKLVTKDDATANFEVSDLGEYSDSDSVDESPAEDTSESSAPAPASEGKNPAVEAAKESY